MGPRGGFAFFTSAFADVTANGELPLCSIKLTSADPEFDAKIKKCDFNRRKLPACEPGMYSLNVNHKPGDLFTNLENPKRRECVKEWTILSFIAMDNNLNKFGEQDMGEMFLGKELDLKNNFDLVVEVDLNQRTGKRYVAERGLNGRVQIEKFVDYFGNEQNTGSPQTLENFLRWGIEQFPARHYMVVISGHGDGFAAMKSKASIRKVYTAASETAALGMDDVGDIDKPHLEANDEFPLGRAGSGIAFDENTGVEDKKDDWLTVSDIRRLFRRVRVDLLGGEKFDLYGADACLMQQAEVAFDLRRSARFIFGSVPIVPEQGLPYTEIMARFAAGKYDFTYGTRNEVIVDGAKALAKDLPQILVDSYTKTIEEGEQGKQKRVMASVIDTEVMGREFVQLLWDFGKAGIEWLRTTPDFMDAKFLVNDAAQAAVAYQRSTIDFLDFTIQLDKELDTLEIMSTPGGAGLAELQAFRVQVTNLNQKVRDSVVASAWGERYKDLGDRVSGISLWMPANIMGYLNFKSVMANSHFYRCACDSKYAEPMGLAGGSRTLNYWGSFIGYVFADDRPTMKPDPQL